MHLLLILGLAAALFAAASFLAVYSWGRFARRARGAPSSALPPVEGETTLDRGILALERGAGGENGLALLQENLDAFAARALAARNAGRSLDLMYYLWHHDLTGRLLAHEMIAAADRGVRVRLLLDDINARGRDTLHLALDSHPNIEVRMFNPSLARQGALRRGLEMLLRAFSVTRRMHNKAWIVDGTAAIVGGRNIGDAYFDAADTNFRDLDVLLLGPAVAQTSSIFERFWKSTAARPIRVLNGAKAPDRAKFLAEADAVEGAGLLKALPPGVTLTEFLAANSEIYWTEDVRVISDPPEKVRGRRRRNWLSRELLPVISAARSRLEIVSPYFIPGRRGTAILAGLVERGVDVAVLTNSLAATDVAAVHGGYAKYRRKLLRHGVKLFELQPFKRSGKMSVFGSKGASLHTKAFTVDGHTGFVGSFNFDPRSVSLNAEMGVIFEHEGLVADLERRFASEKAPDTSYRLSIDKGRLTWEGEDDGEIRRLHHEPEASLFRRLIAALVRRLPIESQL